MKEQVQGQAEVFSNDRKKKKQWQKVVTALAAVAVFCTTYALILPAITWERSLLCEVPEHKHEDACYEAVLIAESKELVCAETEHTHGPECYEQVLVCKKTEQEAHTHGETCFNEAGELICTLEETEGHTHTEACYQQKLKCVEHEHIHTEKCYKVIEAHEEKKLICTKEEHTHSAACFDAAPDEKKEFFCEKTAHTHSKELDCFNEDGTLKCTLEEHKHTLACKSDPKADIETSDVWKQTFSDVKLSDYLPDNILAIAKTQLGYSESTANYEVQEDENTVKGYTRYGAWYGIPYGDWCAMFCSFCMNYAGVEDYPLEADCAKWIEALNFDENDPEKPVYYREAGAYEPKCGDLVFFDWDDYVKEWETDEVRLASSLPRENEREADHVGIVEKFITDEATGKPVKLVVIEGNSDGKVKENTYELTDSCILGYGKVPEYAERRTIKSEPAEDGAVVLVTGKIPEGAEVRITAVTLSDEQINDYFGSPKAAGMTDKVAYDITIWVNGKEWQPDSSVIVEIMSPAISLSENEKLAAAHIDDETEIVSDITAAYQNNGDVTLDADGFSIYMLYKFTVDFHYGDIMFSIAGKSQTTLAKIFMELGIERSADDVENLTFSDDTLLSIEKTEEGWLLTSLESFETEEELAAEFADGEVLVIPVTDAGEDKTAEFHFELADNTVSLAEVYLPKAKNDVTYWIEYSDNGTAWNDMVQFTAPNKDQPYTFDFSEYIEVAFERQYRIRTQKVEKNKDGKENIKTEYLNDKASVTILSAYRNGHDGFSAWLDFCIEKGSAAEPQTLAALSELIEEYETAEKLTIAQRVSGSNYSIYASPADTTAYKYQWQYKDGDTWKSLGIAENMTSIDELAVMSSKGNGTVVRCILVDAQTEDALACSNTYTVNVGGNEKTALYLVSFDENDAPSSAKAYIGKAKNNKTYWVEYTDDGSTWIEGVSIKPNENDKPLFIDFTSLLADPLPVRREFHVKTVENNKTEILSGTYSVMALYVGDRKGFNEWLDRLIEEGAAEEPETIDDLKDLITRFDTLRAKITERFEEDNAYFLDVTPADTSAYLYQWQYTDSTGTWQSLPVGRYDVTSLDVSTIVETIGDGAYIRCRLVEKDSGKFFDCTDSVYVNPNKAEYAPIIAKINEALGLDPEAAGSIAIDGYVFHNYFYYGNVAKDSRVPFYDAYSYISYLVNTYKENGLDAAVAEWKKYLYDLYDPSDDLGKKENKEVYPEYTYGDTDLEWVKDNAPSFHGTMDPVVDPLNYDYLENGVDYSNFVTNLEKHVTADDAGDANEERKYNVRLLTDAQAKANAPVAMIFQIQTSWQMFDMLHANALVGEGYTERGAVANNTELGTLYDIKNALLRFVDYMETKYPGNNLVLGITEVQHGSPKDDGGGGGGNQKLPTTMWNGTDSQGKDLHVTNNYDVLRDGIRNWDSFGNCEHVHYTTKDLKEAVENLESNLYEWKDFYGQPVKYGDIQKSVIIIGGPTENNSGTDGYGCVLPWDTFKSSGMNAVYGIRTNTGTPTTAKDKDGKVPSLISWIDHPDNNGDTPYNYVVEDGVGTGGGNAFTQKYVATNEEAIYNYLLEIAEREMRKNAIDVQDPNVFVENVTVSDTVTDEFIRDTSEPIVATVYEADGETQIWTKTLSLDDEDLEITQNSDGTFTVTYNFGTLYNTQKAELVFGIQAKEDYIGSNNVFSNEGTPDLVYTHAASRDTFVFGDEKSIITVNDPTPLEEILNRLKITGSIADIDSVEFSDSDLMSVESDEEKGWIVTLITPFDSDETLTVRFKDGSEYVIDVSTQTEFNVDGYDTPEINVPIRFNTTDGGHKVVRVPASGDLGDDAVLNSHIISKAVEELVDNYDQINGTLSYVWELPDGTTVPCGSTAVKEGVPQTFPTLSQEYAYGANDAKEEEDEYILHITFTPENFDSNNRNFEQDDITNVAVNPKTRDGSVWILPVDKNTITIRKTIEGGTSTASFPFEASLSTGEFDASSDGRYTVDDQGVAHFYLTDGQSVTLFIPINTTITLTETNNTGYMTYMKNGEVTISDGASAVIAIGENAATIDVVNTIGRRLPTTGGIGTYPFYILGAVLLGGAVIYGCKMRRRRERREE